MDRIKAHTMALLAFAVAAGLRLADDVLSGEAPDVQQLAAIWAGTLMLTVLAYASPEIAQPMAALIIVVAIVNTGPDVYRKLTAAEE